MIPDKKLRIKAEQVWDNVPRDSPLFEQDGKWTLVGWLRRLFLYGDNAAGPKDYKDYDRAVNSLIKAAKISKYGCLYDLEESVDAVTAATLLNKVIKEMTDV